MEDQLAIESLPELIWQIIINVYYDRYIVAKGRRGHNQLLKPIFRCKIASKNLNLLLNDEFFFKALGKPGWRKSRINIFIAILFNSFKTSCLSYPPKPNN
jgi:hypothetical protein